ncbi:tyrosine-type recombinase/integrase [Acidocella sp. MX-AZ02]|uniref:tyrosine-type recombinase/integrase n=1 Tax=Acidocella sp. MX-AZ02 TaxID=1214225 RepID=UPI00028E8320|nr:tyrosine-type recombinase/integrase [Acidocella sp. MX-AZ02]EKM99099.1 integrase family protein [Acidocella sp. MX-AZ02]
MFDCVSNATITPAIDAPVLNPSPATRFSDVLIAVQNAPGLTPKVRENLRGAVTKAASLVSAQGLHGPVDIEKLRRKFERLTPALLGMKTDNAMAAFKSNLRRALRLAGHDIMPGRHVTPLSPDWTALMAKLGGAPIAIKLSRFAHVASAKGWAPDEITQAHLTRFGAILRETNLGSKADKLVRGTVAAWAHGRRHCPDWPGIDLGAPLAETRFYALPWSSFPAGFAEDVESWLARPEAELEHLLAAISKTGSLPVPASPKGRNNGTLRARTISNYRDALRRAASILVRTGHCDAAHITSLTTVVGVAELQCVLSFLAARTGRQKGGHLGYIAFLYYFIARDYLRLPQGKITQLEYLWTSLRGAPGEMSPRSFERLCQFDDDAKTVNMALLPTSLARAARKRDKVDTRAIKLMRTALFTAIALDTGLRVGNIVNLQLDKHVTFATRNKQRIAVLTNPGEEVKNGRTLISELRPESTALLDLWLAEYRPGTCAPERLQAPYLFPSQSGGHLATSLALQSFKDLAAYHAGLDVTPHVTRAYLGKLLLEENPDAHSTVQAVLGHNSVETTLRFYAPVRPLLAKRRAQRLLLAKQQQRSGQRALLKGQQNER